MKLVFPLIGITKNLGAAIVFLAGWLGIHAVAWGGDTNPNLSSDGTLRALSPEESLGLIEVPSGFKMELVASEPMVWPPPEKLVHGE